MSTNKTLLLSKLKITDIIQVTTNQSILEENFKAILEAIQDHDEKLSKLQIAINRQSQIEGDVQLMMEGFNVVGGLEGIKKSLQDMNNEVKVIGKEGENNKNKTKEEGEIWRQEISQIKDQIKDYVKDSNHSGIKEIGIICSQSSNKITEMEKHVISYKNQSVHLETEILEIQRQLEKLNMSSSLVLGLTEKITKFEEKAKEESLKSEKTALHLEHERNNGRLDKGINHEEQKEMKSKIEDLMKKVNELINLKEGSNYRSINSSPGKGLITSESSPRRNEGEVFNPEEKQDSSELMKMLKSEISRCLQKMALKKEDELNWNKQNFDSLNDSILKLEHILSEKANLESIKKIISNLESKISYLYSLLNTNKQSEDDARIGRKNWFCLSCDNQLDSYKGRVGTHVISDHLKSKGMEQEIAGGGMSMRSKSKVELPKMSNKMFKKSEKE